MADQPTKGVKVSEIRKQFPMYADLSDEQLLSGLRKKFYPDMSPSEFYNAVDFDTQRNQLLKDAATDGSWINRARANLGAGFDSFGAGVSQLASKIGIGDGVSDEELRAKRERDQALSDNTTGGKVLQIAGEAAPTLVIPGGALGGGAARVGARVLPRALGAAAGQGGRGATRAIADGALQGAIGGAIGPVTSDESRLLNAGIGAGLGAGLSGALLGGKQLYRAVTREGGRDAAAQQLQGAATDLGQAQANLAQYNGQAQGFPLTGAAAAQDAGLATTEFGQRARDPAAFFAGDQARAAAAARGVEQATAEADQLAARRAARQEGWNQDWAQVAGNVDREAFAKRIGDFDKALAVAARSPESANPQVRGVIDAMRGQIADFGDDFSAGHLQQMRANLNQRGKAMPQNAWQAAPRDSTAVNSLMGEMDRILNESSGNRWQNVLDNYATNSRALDQAKAASKARGQFWDDTGRPRGVTADVAGDVPAITEAGLSRAINAMRNPAGESMASPAARQGLDQTMSALRAQNIVQRVKKAGTAGGGSDTALNQFAAGAVDRVRPGGWVGDAFRLAGNVASARRNAALVEALNDPRQMEALLGRSIRSPADLNAAQDTLIRAMTQGGTVAATQ